MVQGMVFRAFQSNLKNRDFNFLLTMVATIPKHFLIPALSNVSLQLSIMVFIIFIFIFTISEAATGGVL